MLTNRMNFRKGSKWHLTLNPPFRMVPISGNHVHSLHTIQPSCLRAYTQPFSARTQCCQTVTKNVNEKQSTVHFFYQNTCNNTVINSFLLVFKSFQGPFVQYTGKKLNIPKTMESAKDKLHKKICMMQKVKNIIWDHGTFCLKGCSERAINLFRPDGSR